MKSKLFGLLLFALCLSANDYCGLLNGVVKLDSFEPELKTLAKNELFRKSFYTSAWSESDRTPVKSLMFTRHGNKSTIIVDVIESKNKSEYLSQIESQNQKLEQILGKDKIESLRKNIIIGETHNASISDLVDQIVCTGQCLLALAIPPVFIVSSAFLMKENPSLGAMGSIISLGVSVAMYAQGSTKLRKIDQKNQQRSDQFKQDIYSQLEKHGVFDKDQATKEEQVIHLTVFAGDDFKSEDVFSDLVDVFSRFRIQSGI